MSWNKRAQARQGRGARPSSRASFVPEQSDAPDAAATWHQAGDATSKDHYVYIEEPGVLPWAYEGGDWYDANGDLQGSVAYETASWDDTEGGYPFEKLIEVTSLIQAMLDGGTQDGIFIRAISGNSNYTTATRFHPTYAKPEVRLVYDDASTSTIQCQHTCPIDKSTTQRLGNRATGDLRAGNEYMLYRVDLTGESGTLTSAHLAVQITSHFDSTALQLQVMATIPKIQETIAVEQGLAAGYTLDGGIGAHNDVIEYCDFKIENGAPRWKGKGGGNSFWVRDAVNGWATGTIPIGAHQGMSTYFAFALQDPVLTEPTQIYFRYYLMFDDASWQNVASGGKMPGFGGQDSDGEAQGGNGGDNTTGFNGWSARGQYSGSPSANNPMNGKTFMGNYVYHIDDADDGPNAGFGEIRFWTDVNNFTAALQTDTWYCIEQYLQLNTYDSGVTAYKDGILKCWVDGKVCYNRTNYRWVINDNHPIAWIWFNVYHGGDTDAVANHTVKVRDIVIANSYIGPQG